MAFMVIPQHRACCKVDLGSQIQLARIPRKQTLLQHHLHNIQHHLSLSFAVFSFLLSQKLSCPTFSNDLCHGASQRLWEQNGKEVEEDSCQDELGAGGKEVKKSLGQHWPSREKDNSHVVEFEEPKREWDVTDIGHGS